MTIKPPSAGWKVLHQELPGWTRPSPEMRARMKQDMLTQQDDGSRAGNQSVVAPATPQTAGTPYVFYRSINFLDTKPTGLRMSSCFAALDDARSEMFCICDQSVKSFKNVSDPFTTVCMELMPAIQQLSNERNKDGLLYTRKDSKGAVLSWLRCEVSNGFPMFPLKTEESGIYLVGKDKTSNQRTKVCRARFVEAFVDEKTNSALSGEQWEQDAEQFWSRVRSDHCAPHLQSERSIQKLYPSGDAFKPTAYKHVSWRMGFGFGDLWGILYHGKTPEMLWEVNKLAGGPFAALLDADPDPQAVAMNLPKKMEVGTEYSVLCYLEEKAKRAVYVLLPAGSTFSSECVLAVSALYDWGASPASGETLCSQDIDVLGGGSRASLIGFAFDGKDAKPSKNLDLSSLPKL